MSTKKIQGELWSIAPHYWAKYFEPFFMPMYKTVLQYLKPDENISLLDAGCGSGLFSNMAIKSGAQVIAIDAAPGLLKLARARNPEYNFLEEDIEALPFAPGSFDIVAGFNSFQYAANFTNALIEAKRVLRDDGKLVVGIWDKQELSEAANILKAIGSLLPSPPPGTPGPFALSEDGKMEEICTEAGLKIVHKTSVGCPFLYYSVHDAVKAFLGTGPAAAAINCTSEESVREKIIQAMKPYRLTEDMYHLQNSFLVFVMEKKQEQAGCTG